jgi:hypothetical protein
VIMLITLSLACVMEAEKTCLHFAPSALCYPPYLFSLLSACPMKISSRSCNMFIFMLTRNLIGARFACCRLTFHQVNGIPPPRCLFVYVTQIDRASVPPLLNLLQKSNEPFPSLPPQTYAIYSHLIARTTEALS